MPRDSELPLSFTQERVWFLSQWNPESPAYNIPAALRVSGRLDVEALERSINEVVRRHEILRATCRNVGGRPVLTVAPELTLSLETADLGDIPMRGREQAFLQLARQEADRPFDLARGPLLRARLFRLGPDEHGLLLATHHFVADGWSIGVLLHEISVLYDAFQAGRASPLAELPIQYVDFAHWQREWVQSGALEEDFDYWNERLRGAPPLLQLPTDRPRPAEQSYRGATHRFRIPETLREAVRARARQEGATPFMVFLAAFQMLLHRYSHQDDIVVGTAISSRTRAELEGLIGTFANNLVLRTDLSGDPTFRETLGRVRDVAVGAYAHPDVPFERLIDALEPDRDLSHTPLFQVLFLLHRVGPARGLELPGLSVRSVPLDTGTAKFDLSLTLFDGADRLEAELEYSTDLFDADTIERMAGHFRVLLEHALNDPDQHIDGLPILTGREERQLLEEWNATQTDYPEDLGVHLLFEAQVRRSPDAVAIEHDGRRLSYRELNARANRLAHYLKSLGVGPGVRVAICMDRSADLLVGLLGILKAGGAYVPLDPGYPRERLRFILDETRAAVLVTEGALLAELPDHTAQAVCLDRERDAVERQPGGDPHGEATSSDLAYIIYTSGSTGRPKGVQISHRSLSNFLHAMSREPGLSRDDVLLAVTTVSFDIAALELFLPICVGARTVIVSREVAADGIRLGEALERSGATVMQATPATWRLLVEAGWQGRHGFRALCGGEALPRELAEQLLERTGALWNLYGPTETTIWSTVQRVESGAGPVPIGKPIANTRVYVLDSHETPLPIGVPGELYIGGVGVARGYLERPVQTADRFLPDPFTRDPDGRMYRTGDWVRYRSDGSLEYLWRTDHQVKVRGFRIELAEVEAALKSHPAVADTVTVAREYGPADVRLVAYFLPMGEETPTGTELRTFVRAKLPEYMVPSLYVALEAFPLTPNGKTDRRALPEPELLQVRGCPEIEPPRTETERALAEIWKAVLGTESVGRNDNFFDLGGHSLLSMQVIFQVEENLGTRLTPRDVALNTLGQLAAHCERDDTPGPDRAFRAVARRLWGSLLAALPVDR